MCGGGGGGGGRGGTENNEWEGTIILSLVGWWFGV